MSMRQLNNLSDVYLEAVYGKSPEQVEAERRKKDDLAGAPLTVTNADKKANTKAYQNLKKGVKGYKAADHMKEEDKKAKKDYDGDGKIESGKDEYFGSKDKAIKKAMGKKVKQEEDYSDWRADLVERDLIEVVDDSDSDKEDDDYGSDKKVKEKKVKNCVKVNPSVKIESVEEGYGKDKKKKKGHDCASKVKHEEYGVGDCLKEMHDLDEDGNVSHYDVKFASRIVRNVPSSDLVVLEGMYHEHVIRDTSEGYQRNPEADPRSARQKRMDDPDKGINSPAFRKFMADKDKGSSAKKSSPTKSKPNPEGTLNLSPEERKKREAKRREDLYKRSADMRRDHKKRGIGVYAKGAENPGADMDKKLGI